MKPWLEPISRHLLRILFIAVLSAAHVALAQTPADEAAAAIKASGIKGGIVVHIGSGDGQMSLALRATPSYQVQGLDADAKQVAKAREWVRSKGAYGPVTFSQLEGSELPYIDGIINLVVAEDLHGIPMDEVLRVLCPKGVACIKQNGKWVTTLKPRPTDIDDWTHYFYDARGNAVSHDDKVGPPERLQWVGSPRWSRHHDRMSSLSAMVSGNGRLFYIMDQGSRISILMPSKWVLTSRDAFNGSILWEKPIEKWQSNLWPLKSGPTELTRRLVTDGERVFVTLGIDAPVSCLDPATGEKMFDYASTKGAEEIIHVNGVLYVLVNPNPWILTDFAPKFNTGDQKRVETEFNWDEKPRNLVALDAATGRVLWVKEKTKIAPLTLASDGKRVLYHDGDKLVCLNPADGQERWNTGPEGKRKLFEFNYGPRLIIDKDVVLYAGGDGAMKGINADTGKELWNAPHNKSGYRSPEDLIVAGGLVWNAPTSSGNMSGEFAGRDPMTGQVKVEFPPDVNTYWFHHRCYIAKATEKYILPSRTGIEFVDISAKHWDINHWVRGACLYGVMPCNGLVYAGPHDCACYPEAKLDGMNALAPAGSTSHPKPPPDDQRLLRGPAYTQALELDADAKDWPTYRHDKARSGYTSQSLLDNMGRAWELKLGGQLSAMSIAGGKVFVAQIDTHTLFALDQESGKELWHFTADARVDSPPTFWKGRLLFGGMDGYVYCLRATDGALVWRFQAAPGSQRHMAFEQLESVWPVHGSVLVEDDTVNLVAGRSIFLDGGLRFIRLDAASGKKLAEVVYDDKDPDTGRDIQERLKTLQMPVGLNDILSSDGKFMYLRSQKIAADGKRIDIGPVSGNAIEQGAAQHGEGTHIFAPMGFLDDTWFHRSYWVYGKSFAGGHNGYFQAGKYTPAGRILVFDDKNVYGFGREPQYYKWTTTMEHELFAASKEAPNVKVDAAAAGEGGGKKNAAGKNANAKGKGKAAAGPVYPSVKFTEVEKVDPSNKPLSVEAWVLPDGPDGIIVAHGGGLNGYALALEDGRPGFSIRANKELATAQAARPLDDGWHHLVGIITEGNKIQLFVDGQLAAEAKTAGYIPKRPNQGLLIGASGASQVSDFGKGAPYTGLIDLFAVFPRALDEEEITEHANLGNGVKRGNGAMVACSFDEGDARDDSGNGIDGVISGVDIGKGKSGKALWFHKAAGATTPVVANAKGQPAAPANKGSFVEHKWAHRVPVVTRAMAMAGSSVFIAGPPDTLDEEYAFERLTQKDPAIQADIAEQNASLDGKRGASLMSVSTETGKTGPEIKMESPPVWDGMAIAQGHLFVASVDGKVTCYGVAKK